LVVGFWFLVVGFWFLVVGLSTISTKFHQAKPPSAEGSISEAPSGPQGLYPRSSIRRSLYQAEGLHQPKAPSGPQGLP